MSLKTLLAKQRVKKLRFAVLRPINKALIPAPGSLVGLTVENFQKAMSDSLEDGAIFMGLAKPGCLLLFDENGIATGEKMEPGDVLDEIADFERACATGAYKRIKRGNEVQPAPTAN